MTSPLLAVLLLVVAIVLFVLARRLSARTQEIQQLRADHAADKARFDEARQGLTARLQAAERQVERLSKWQGIADADEQAAALRKSAQEMLDQARRDVAELLRDAEQRAASLVAEATARMEAATADSRREAKALKDQAKNTLDAATLQASAIMQAAEKRAEEIAGDAYAALKNADHYERTFKAMKNLIDGYGDQYLIPERSLLDDLADEFGHKDAGDQLKRARERSASMVRLGTAVTCEYVEASRRETAIRFVVDAFNGKVDSILSRVKHDNVGTLAQEIRDAYTLVNYNGKAFREARVMEDYLSARLDELKWASVVQQLKLDEREEQRRIKEQIREEEKARREYERALRDSAKEQDLLQRAMEKARSQFDQASAEQKAKYEQQLQELAQKLKEAEERNQRALSMAEQTKRGHVYVISNVGSFGEHVYKIGLTRRLEPLDRIRELGDASVPFEFDVHALIFSDDAPALESRLQRHFLLMQMNKVNFRKEFFRVDLAHIREEIEKLGLTAKWTMAAEAREYRETLAIERLIASDPQKREAWLTRQLELGAASVPLPEPEEAGS